MSSPIAAVLSYRYSHGYHSITRDFLSTQGTFPLLLEPIHDAMPIKEMSALCDAARTSFWGSSVHAERTFEYGASNGFEGSST